MKELKEAIPKEEFEAITKEIEKTMMGEIEDHPNNKYLSLNEARNDIYNLYIEALKEEAGFIITNNIESLKYKRGQVTTKISKIEYNTNWANSRKGQRDNLLKELKQVKRDLIQLTQYTRELEATGDTAQDNLKLQLLQGYISTWNRI